MLRAAILLTIGVLLVGAGCGGSGSDASDETSFEDVFAAVQGLGGKQREDKLAELAKAAGGQLSLYTSTASETIDELAGAFGDRYGVDTGVYRANSEAILPRLSEEAKAGFHGADVVGMNGVAMARLNDEGLLVDYAPPGISALIAGSKAKGWTSDYFATFVLARNTKLLPSGGPASWEDLADPKWKGKVAIEAGDFDWYATLWKHWVDDEGKSPEEADRLFEGIARNALFVSGHSLMSELHAAGEFPLSVNYASRIDKTVKEGAPLTYDPPVQPLFPEPQGIGLVKDAKNPAAAILYEDWLLSEEGQKILKEKFSEPALKSLAVAPGARRIVIDAEALSKEEQKWSDQFDRLVRLGKAVEG